MSTREIDPRVRIGHVHLKVADIERALAFYCSVGFALAYLEKGRAKGKVVVQMVKM